MRVATISSSTTLSDLIAELKDTAQYRSNDSLSEGQRRAAALETLILILPQQSKHEAEELGYDLRTLKSMLDDVNKWVAAKTNATAGRVKYVGFNGFRT